MEIDSFDNVLRVDFADLENKSLDDLYLRLAREIYPSESFGGDDVRRMRARGRKWFDDNTTVIRRQVCPRAKVMGEATVDLAAVADTLSGFLDKPVGYVVAAIVMKVGLLSFCQGYSDDH